MSNLERLVEIGHLKREPFSRPEFDGLVKSGRARLRDAGNDSLSLESRFDLAYNAAHALSLAALRYKGYRSSNRYVVFQSLPHTLGISPSVWRVLAKGHAVRNQAEYEGSMDADERLVEEMVEAAEAILDQLDELEPPSG